MSVEIANLAGPGLDQFEDEGADESGPAQNNVHIRVQQRNGRKCVTTIQGLPPDLDLKKIIKELKKSFSCNGSTQQDPELGQIIQLSGDQRDKVKNFLLEEGLVEKDRMKIHGH